MKRYGKGFLSGLSLSLLLLSLSVEGDAPLRKYPEALEHSSQNEGASGSDGGTSPRNDPGKKPLPRQETVQIPWEAERFYAPRVNSVPVDCENLILVSFRQVISEMGGQDALEELSRMHERDYTSWSKAPLKELLTPLDSLLSDDEGITIYDISPEKGRGTHYLVFHRVGPDCRTCGGTLTAQFLVKIENNWRDVSDQFPWQFTNYRRASTNFLHPLLVDLDGNGKKELLLEYYHLTRPDYSGLFVFVFSDGRWVPADETGLDFPLSQGGASWKGNEGTFGGFTLVRDDPNAPWTIASVFSPERYFFVSEEEEWWIECRFALVGKKMVEVEKKKVTLKEFLREQGE